MLHKINFPPFTFRKSTKNDDIGPGRRYVIKFGEKSGPSCNFLLKFGPPTKKSGHPWCRYLNEINEMYIAKFRLRVQYCIAYSKTILKIFKNMSFIYITFIWCYIVILSKTFYTIKPFRWNHWLMLSAT